jgi:hypothetical protein
MIVSRNRPRIIFSDISTGIITDQDWLTDRARRLRAEQQRRRRAAA